MHRPASAVFPYRSPLAYSAWLARRWYYTARSHRAYSVRQISPGDRRLLAEFAVGLPADVESHHPNELNELLFDHVITDMDGTAAGFVALESAVAGDRVIGVCAYAPVTRECARFNLAVADAYRDEQVGRTLLMILVRHAKRVGVPCLTAEMQWSNRAMQVLAVSAGFRVEAVPRDRNLRRISLALK